MKMIRVWPISPILDAMTYQVDFVEWEVSKLTANSITESMYTQCDADGNDNLLLDLFINYHKNNNRLYLMEQGRPVTNSLM